MKIKINKIKKNKNKSKKSKKSNKVNKKISGGSNNKKILFPLLEMKNNKPNEKIYDYVLNEKCNIKENKNSSVNNLSNKLNSVFVQ